MRVSIQITNWLETHWLNPAYSSGLLGGLALFFFFAATNTMSGWLYVMSGMILALLAIAAILSRRNLRGLRVVRRAIQPVSVGEQLTVELRIENQTTQSRTLLQIEDAIPAVLGSPIQQVIDRIEPNGAFDWVYQHSATWRGVYRWQTVTMRTAAPLGLFWCRRSYRPEAVVTIYPTVLPLSRCPLIDQSSDRANSQTNEQRTQTATEGMTRSLRPYRWGDPMRMIHWRTSARYGELRVRELEVFTDKDDIIIALDTTAVWNPEAFEAAVTAVASLYFYAARHHFIVRLWTGGTGLIQGQQTVLETLAEITFGEEVCLEGLPDAPIVWLTQNPASLAGLSAGSRWLLWENSAPKTHHLGIVVDFDRSLQSQLQNSPKSV